jgi:hypothetical protein
MLRVFEIGEVQAASPKISHLACKCIQFPFALAVIPLAQFLKSLNDISPAMGTP